MSARQGFAIWITGLPGSGKSTITRELALLLAAAGARPLVLESDVLRGVLTPEPTYRDDERDRFYRQIAGLGAMLAGQGFPVIIDATANRRAYRDQGRACIPRFLEVFVQCTPELCRARDPKGIYAAAARGEITNVPGIQAAYEEPPAADVTLDCREAPAVSARKVLDHLRGCGYL